MADISSAVMVTLQAMASDDANKPALLALLENGQVNVHVALRVIARVLRPRAYLEIGVRRGWSLAQVLSEAPACHAYLVDAWIPEYSGCANPGEAFVREELAKVAPAHYGDVIFWCGNSHEILPGLLRGLWFDLVLVDGDHTADGALQDLRDVMPHVRTGGVVVFDDVVDTADSPGECATLREVWEQIQREFTGWTYITHLPGRFGVAIRGL